MQRLHFKFLQESRSDRRDRLLRRLEREGARLVTRMFEGEEDAELASLYVVVSEDADADERVRAALEDADEVEFVERPVDRRLIR